MAHERILIVEDEGVTALHLQDSLARLGYEPLGPARTAARACELTRRLQPDLVLMDVNLDGKDDGIDAAQRIRAELDVPIIFVTAHADDLQLRRAQLSQPYGYLIKPVHERDLRAAIEIALYKHAMDRSLAEKEERLRLISELMSDLIYSLRVEEDGSLVVEWLSGATNILGQESLQRMLGRADWMRSVYAEDRSKAIALIRRTLAGESLVTELRIVRSTGKKHWLRIYSRPLYDKGQGKVTRIVGGVQDISEYKRMEEALRQSEERYRLLVEHQGEGVGIVDAEERFVFANPAAHEIFGVPPETLVGRSLGEFVDQATLDFLHQQTALRRVGEKSVYEMSFTRNDGERRYLLVTATPYQDQEGKFLGAFGVFRDITDYKEALEAVRQAEQRYRQLAEQIPAIPYVAALDEVGSTLYIGPQIETILGFTAAQWIADPALWIKRLHEEDRARVQASLDRARATGQEFQAEYRMIAADGRVVWFSDRARPLLDETGRPQFLQGVMYEITERKQAEELLQRANEELERRVAERTKELLASEVRRQQAIIQERRLLARELHDGVAQVLSYVNLKAQAAEALLAAGHIDAAREQMVQLASAARSTYVDVREAILGLRAAEDEAQGLLMVLKRYLSQMSQLVDFTISIEAQPALQNVTFAPTCEAQIIRIVQEALTNVRKHARAAHAWIYLYETANEIVVEVADDGIGFDPARELAETGQHVGLQTMRERAETIGARLEIESAPGTGTRVSLSIPRNMLLVMKEPVDARSDGAS